MIRLILTRTLLFALPFALYGAWFALMRLRAKTPGPHTPWTVLIVAGLALVAASFIYVGLTEGKLITRRVRGAACREWKDRAGPRREGAMTRRLDPSRETGCARRETRAVMEL